MLVLGLIVFVRIERYYYLYLSTVPQDEYPKDPCLPSPCGPNALCRAVGNAPACSCMQNYIGVPPNCRPECSINSDCPANKACIREKCRDPCPGSCGVLAQCTVINHTPSCVCPEGYTGDPFVSCNPAPQTPRKNHICRCINNNEKLTFHEHKYFCNLTRIYRSLFHLFISEVKMLYRATKLKNTPNRCNLTCTFQYRLPTGAIHHRAAKTLGVMTECAHAYPNTLGILSSVADRNASLTPIVLAIRRACCTSVATRVPVHAV